MKLGRKKFLVALACLLSVTWLAGSALADNLVINGGFESGNVSFISDYDYCNPSPLPDNVDLRVEGTYAIGTSPSQYHSDWAAQYPLEGSVMMIINGAIIDGETVWGQTVGVTANTDYYFSAMINSSLNHDYADLAFSINGVELGTFSPAQPVYGGYQFYAIWNSGDSTSAILAIVNQVTVAGGNDFSLDDIRMDTVNPGGEPVNPVPLPSSVLLLGSGLAGLGFLRRQWSLKK